MLRAESLPTHIFDMVAIGTVSYNKYCNEANTIVKAFGRVVNKLNPSVQSAKACQITNAASYNIQNQTIHQGFDFMQDLKFRLYSFLD